MHGQVQRRDDLARAGTDRRRDRAEPVRELLVVHGHAQRTHALELHHESGAVRDRVRAARHELDLVEDLLESVCGHESEQRLAHRGAVGGQPRADVEVEVDLPLPRARRAAALDVDDVRAVEHGHVRGEPGRVGQRLQMRDRDLADVHRVDRREAEVEHAGPESIALRLGILLQVAERVSVAM